MNRRFKRITAVALTVTLVALSGGRAHAALAPSAAPAPFQIGDRTQDVKTIESFLAKKEVQTELQKMGFTESEVQSRLANLSDDEIRQVASQIETQKPAGDGGGVIVTILVIGILVLLFVYLLKRV